jgi:hypothetical protein
MTLFKIVGSRPLSQRVEDIHFKDGLLCFYQVPCVSFYLSATVQ